MPDGSRYKVGQPYKIKGTTYRPAVDYGYVETGTASWYGRHFHGRRTANGEIYDMNEVTAAHRTLPMPSMVRVTNLDNGRSIAVRINDRGPFAKNRIIDLSRRSAQLLGYLSKGLARVRVEIMAAESRRLAAISKGQAPGHLVARTGLAKELAIVRDPKFTRVAVIETGPLPKATLPKAVVADELNPSTAAGGNPKRYYIQAGAFRSYENAIRLQSKLVTVGEVVIVPATPDVPVYRVRIGPYADAAYAEGLLQVVTAKGQANARVISD